MKTVPKNRFGKYFKKVCLLITLLLTAITFFAEAATTLKFNFINRSSKSKISIRYEKKFLLSKTIEIQFEKTGQSQVLLDIDELTAVDFKLDSLYFRFYLFPGDVSSVYCNMASRKTTKESLLFSGSSSDLNQTLFNTQYKSVLKNLNWRTGEEAAPQIVASKIKQFYKVKRSLLKKSNRIFSKRSLTALAHDSISDEYIMAAAIFNLVKRNKLKNDTAWSFIKDNIAAPILTPPSITLLTIPAVRLFWAYGYVPFLINLDVEKEPDLFHTKGYYVSALKKIDSVFSEPLRSYTKASLLFDILQDPSSFRPGVDSLWRLTREFTYHSHLHPLTKKALVDEISVSAGYLRDLKKGDSALDFSGIMLDGSMFSLSNYKNKDVLIDVWASWCKPCIGQIFHVKKHEDYLKSKGLIYLMVSVDEDAARWHQAVNKYAADTSINHVLVSGGVNGTFAKAYGIRSIPRYILIRNLKVENISLPLPVDSNFLTTLDRNLQ